MPDGFETEEDLDGFGVYSGCEGDAPCRRCDSRATIDDEGLCESCDRVLRELGYKSEGVRFEFWADGRQFFSAHRSLRVDQLRFLVGAASNRNCVQERPPDLVPIGDDGQPIDLTQCPRFLFLPNATYGGRR